MRTSGFIRADRARVVVFAAAILLAGGCDARDLASEDQPVATVQGTVVTEDGSPARGCKLEFYDTAAVKPSFVWDIPAEFTRQVQTAKLVDNFYFRVRCEDERMAARSRVFDMAYLSNHDFVLDLGRMTVGAGMVSVTGRVATMDGSTPDTCRLGLYTGFHTQPVATWDVAGNIAVEFAREKIDGHFRFQLQCEGYSQPYVSPHRPESWLAETGGIVELGPMLVRK